jgi:hypothetical protein
LCLVQPEDGGEMDLLSKAQLTYLSEYRDEVCISVYMPSYRTNPEKRQNQVRFKNLVRKAEDELFKKGLRGSDIDKLLSPARPLFGDDIFWSFFQSDGFCAFMSPGDFMYFRVPVHFKENVTVMDRYYIKPLLGMALNDNRFFMISLGLEGPKLYQCSRFGINEIPLPNVPETFEEATKYSVIEREIQFHTNSSPLGTREAGVAFHGSGGGEDGKNEYFKKVAHGISDVIGQEKAPLLFAGLEQHFGTYKKASSYAFFIEDNYIAMNPGDMRTEELHTKAIEIMEPYFLANRNRAIETYYNLAATGKTASDIEAILPRAFEGRVDTLFISPETVAWGIFDTAALKAYVHTSPDVNDQDLVDLTALYTHLKGGAIYEVAPDANVPSPAAIFRY